MTHLTDAELTGFASGSLAGDDLLRADDHLAACAECRERTASLRGAASAADRLRVQLGGPTQHLSEEELQDLVTSRLDEPRRASVLRHLNECPTCDLQVKDLRAWSSRPAQPSWRPALAKAAAVLLAVLVPFLIWKATGRRNTASAPQLAGLSSLGENDRANVRAALDAGAAALPDVIVSMTGPRESLMGPPRRTTETVTLSRPVATGTVEDQPRFEWSAVAGGSDYEVTVFDDRSNVVARSPRVTSPQWTPEQPLPRDRTYIWQVAIRRGRETVIAPLAPDLPAKFRVIDDNTADVLRRTAAAYPRSHVLLGILYMEAGVREDAAREFRQVGPADTGADVARRSLQRLELFDAQRSSR